MVTTKYFYCIELESFKSYKFELNKCSKQLFAWSKTLF